MAQQKKNKGYLISENPITGKRSKRKIDQEWEDFMSDDGLINSPPVEVIRIEPCPYKFDNPEIANKLTKPFKTAQFTCEVNVEISLAAKSEIPIEKHIHEVVIEVDKSEFPPDTDFSEYEFDSGKLFCGIFYQITPKISVTLKNNQIIDDENVKKFIKKVSDNAVKENEELQENHKKEFNEQRLENHQQNFEKINSYFQEHLTESIKRVVKRLEFESHLLNDRAEERELGIKIMLEEEEKALRRRLPTTKGRVPIKQRSDYKDVRREFIKECSKILDELESKKLRLNKNQLAKQMFRSDNPLLLLNRKLKDFDLSFDDILSKFIEQKSS